MKGKKRTRALNLIFLAALATLASVFGAGVFLTADDGFSPEENRTLASAPDLSVAALLDGSLFSDLGKYCADHVPFRLSLIRLKAFCELGLGKGQNKGVMFLQDGRLADRCEYEDLSLLGKNLREISSFKEKYACTVAAVPRSADLNLPFVSEDAKRAATTVYSHEGMDYGLYALLSETEGKVYYKTDHHLDRDGVYALYAYVAVSLGVTPYTKEDFRWETVTDSFLGSAYSKGGALSAQSDSISLPRYDGDGDYEVTCRDDGCTQTQLYSMDALDTKDKYSVFLGGNHGVLDVTLPHAERPRLLLVKDSFANALVPLLARHFDITVYDPRYYSEELDLSGYHSIAIVCGIDTLATTPFRVRVDSK